MSAPVVRGRTLSERWVYRTVRATARIVGVTCFDLRCFGREHLDFPGSALLLSTHQSTLDPVMIGLMGNTELAYLARKTLFKSRLFAALIRALNAIEIDREGGGLAGLKETLKRLKQGKKVLIFPEGTRTSTGHPAELKPGFISLARRGSVPLVPMAVTGAFTALQRGSLLPRYSPLCVYVGAKIDPALVAQWDDQQLLAEIHARLLECHRRATNQTERATRLRLG
jgi:1-acyl-sn-glycerol-3-phosphate acyltransferase